MNTTALGINKYQGQICSSDFENKVFSTNIINFSNYNQYVKKIGIYAPPGAVFKIWQNNSTYTVEIGKTFMYEATNVKINAIEYLGNRHSFTTAGIPYSSDGLTYYEDQVYSLPNSNDRNIFIDYIAIEENPSS